jgi:hypothetical protein
MKTSINPGIYLLILALFLPGYGWAKYSGDTEKPDGIFLISTPEDLNAVGSNPSNWDDYLFLMADINMTGYTYTTAFIAPDINDDAGFQGTPFTGTFDGDGHTIYWFHIDDNGAGKEYLGMIGYLGLGGSIKDLTLADVNVSGSDGSNYTAGLCGYNYYGTITNCTVTGQITVKTNSEPVSGICGQNVYGTINDCYADTSISGGYMARMLGGICGTNFYGTVSDCYATGPTSGYLYIGGLCGLNAGGDIERCYSTTSAQGSSYIGSLCGSNHEGTISDCYANGSATGTDNLIGGLCGYNYGGTISNCYSTGYVTGASGIGGLCGDLSAVFSSIPQVMTTGLELRLQKRK